MISPKDLEIILNEELARLSNNSLTDKFDQDEERLGWIYYKTVSHLIKTPREIKRIFNNLRFVLAHIEGEVCFTDLFCLSVLSIKAPEVYKYINNKPEMFVGTSFSNTYHGDTCEKIVNDHKKEMTDLLDKYPKIDRGYIEKLIGVLFPLTSSNVQLYSASNDGDKSGRVSSYKRLFIAMHLNIPKGYVSQDDVLKFLEGNIDRNKYLRETIRNESIDRLFEILNHQNFDIGDQKIVEVLIVIYDVCIYSNYLEKEEKSQLGFFGLSLSRKIIILTEDLIDKFEDKYVGIKELMSNRRHLPITTDILRRLLFQHGEFESDRIEKEWITGTEFEEIKETWINNACEELKDESGLLLTSMFSSHVYYVLYRIAPDRVKSIFKIWMQEKNGVVKIAELLKNSGKDSTNGVYVSVSEELTKLLDIRKLRELVDQELASNRNIPTHLEAVYLSIKNNRQYYLTDASVAKD